MQYDKEWVQRLSSDGAQVVVRCGGRPITSYAVILEYRASEGRRPDWRAICIIDNHMKRCHMHRYHGRRKLAPEAFGARLSINEELANAVKHLVEHHETIIAAWARTNV